MSMVAPESIAVSPQPAVSALPSVSPPPQPSPTPAVPAEPQAALNLRPALVDGARIWVECPAWCVEDHVAANDRHLADLDHGGHMADLTLTDVDGELQLLGHVRLSSEPGSSRPELRRPHLYVADGGGFDAFVALEDAEGFADGLVAVAERVRAMAWAAR